MEQKTDASAHKDDEAINEQDWHEFLARLKGQTMPVAIARLLVA